MARRLPPRPLPRTATPVPGEYHLDYIARLATANRVEFLELAEIVNDTAAITLHRGRREWEQHQQERLATLASQPLARITRLWWPDPAWSMRDPGGFRQMLRPACRRCTARRGIAGPVACYMPPHQTVCRRHRLWTGPSARTDAGQLDVSHLPELLGAQRRHLALVRDHQLWHVDDAIADATRAIRHALRDGAGTPQQRRRLSQLGPGTHPQTAPAVNPCWSDDVPGHPGQEIAIYPDVIRLAARTLRAKPALPKLGRQVGYAERVSQGARRMNSARDRNGGHSD